MTALYRALREVLPKHCIISDKTSLRPYECDGLSAYRQMPKLVVLPETVTQVQAVMKVCQRLKTPIVPRGAGTCLSGGATPHPDGIVLSVARLNKILHINKKNRTATVEPGVTNLAISNAVTALNLYYAPDPSSQIACTIGGNVAENAGGVHCLKYGLTLHNVLQVKLATIEGELITLGSQSLQQAGYDLLSLIIGSEGMLGMVVEVTVRLLPKAQKVVAILAEFSSVKEASIAVAAVISSGIIPAGFEMMDNHAIRAAEDFAKAGYPKEAAAILICELDGLCVEIDAQLAQLITLLKRHGAVDCRCAKDEAERIKFWSGRKNAFPAVGRLSPDYYCMDGTIPRSALAQVLDKIGQLSEQYNLAVANVFHAGDGNLHPLILYDASVPGELESVEEFGGKILDLCIAVGGTITGEHGVGLEKIDRMCVQFNDAELAQFHAVRKVLDPQELLNPGKAIPTLNRCAEFGAMHVHQGKLAHPELERF